MPRPGQLRERRWSKTWRVPTSGAIGRARLRLGAEPMKALFARACRRERRWSKTWRVPTSGAIGRARLRLGAEPMKALFARACRPVALPATTGAW
ncbi:transposase domain-containing protein, partial [Streptomyces sanglieri]|uniref:transposase domain-containing protein n=1 Tax=Streptomyces sanglieri TaxID=193460 RepID=UPI0035262A35